MIMSVTVSIPAKVKPWMGLSKPKIFWARKVCRVSQAANRGRAIPGAKRASPMAKPRR